MSVIAYVYKYDIERQKNIMMIRFFLKVRANEPLIYRWLTFCFCFLNFKLRLKKKFIKNDINLSTC